MKGIPKIKNVQPLEDMLLFVEFENNIIKKYDIKPLLKKYGVFENLKNQRLFNAVRVDCGGFGIAWNDEIDLSEYEIWQNGVIYDEKINFIRGDI